MSPHDVRMTGQPGRPTPTGDAIRITRDAEGARTRHGARRPQPPGPGASLSRRLARLLVDIALAVGGRPWCRRRHNPRPSPRGWWWSSRWASMAHWAALFRAPTFARLSAHGHEHCTISAGAFVPAE